MESKSPAAAGVGVTLTIGPNTSYRAQDLVSERRYKGKYEEWLVRWVLQPPPEKMSEEEEAAYERATKEYCMWMRLEEIEACCPQLASASVVPASPTVKGEDTDAAEFPGPSTSTAQKDEALAEMRMDVQSLIARAKRLLAAEGSTLSVAGGKVLANVVGILNAYAKIGVLTDAFQEYGAVDLLLGLLGSRDLEVRRKSSDMLRSLTSFDLSIRSYILLQLLKSDEGSESSLQSRQMLLDLFSETAPADESGSRAISYPQVCLSRSLVHRSM